MGQSNSDLSETLDEVAELMDAADEIKKAYISLISRIKEKKDIVCDLFDKMSYALGCLLDPDEGYILLAKQLAGLSTLITDALNLKSEIPKEMVPQIERLKECADNAKQALQKMRDRIEPLLKYVEDTIEKDIPINKKCVRRKLRVIIVSRDNCKNYLKKADEAMSDLNDMASSRLLLCGIGVGCTALTATAVSGFLAVQAAGTAAACGTGAAVAETSIGVAAATAIAGTLACGKLFLLLANYAHWFNNVKSECEKKLHPIRDKLDESEREISLFKEELDD